MAHLPNTAQCRGWANIMTSGIKSPAKVEHFLARECVQMCAKSVCLGPLLRMLFPWSWKLVSACRAITAWSMDANCKFPCRWQRVHKSRDKEEVTELNLGRSWWGNNWGPAHSFMIMISTMTNAVRCYWHQEVNLQRTHMCSRREQVRLPAMCRGWPLWHFTSNVQTASKGGSDGPFLASDMHAFEALRPCRANRTALSTNADVGVWAWGHSKHKQIFTYICIYGPYLYIQKNWYVCFGKKPSWAASLLQTNIQMGPKWKFPTSTSVLFKMLARSAYKKSSYNNVACMHVEGFCFVIFEFVFGALHLQWASSPHDDYIYRAYEPPGLYMMEFVFCVVHKISIYIYILYEAPALDHQVTLRSNK